MDRMTPEELNKELTKTEEVAGTAFGYAHRLLASFRLLFPELQRQEKRLDVYSLAEETQKLGGKNPQEFYEYIETALVRLKDFTEEMSCILLYDNEGKRIRKSQKATDE